MRMPDWLRTLLDPTWRLDEELAAFEAEWEAQRRSHAEEIELLPHNVIRLSAHRRQQRPVRNG